MKFNKQMSYDFRMKKRSGVGNAERRVGRKAFSPREKGDSAYTVAEWDEGQTVGLNG